MLLTSSHVVTGTPGRTVTRHPIPQYRTANRSHKECRRLRGSLCQQSRRHLRLAQKSSRRIQRLWSLKLSWTKSWRPLLFLSENNSSSGSPTCQSLHERITDEFFADVDVRWQILRFLLVVHLLLTFHYNFRFCCLNRVVAHDRDTVS